MSPCQADCSLTVLPVLGGRNLHPAAHVEREVRDGAVAEDEVAGSQLRPGDLPADAELRAAGVGQRHARLRPGHHGEA
jgi:hypothetical protein